jgi:hypothetical protein
MIKEFLSILASALILCSPMWGAGLFVWWLDRRPTPQQKWERNHRNVLRRREQITKRGW